MSRKPANSPLLQRSWRLAATLLAVGLAGATAHADARAKPPATGIPQQVPPEQRYEQCLDQARTHPKEGLATAQNWHDAGGGAPSTHCLALALIGLKRYGEAAKRLEELANAMMEATPDMRGEALEQAGQAWLLAGKGAQAKTDFEAALAYHADDPDLLIDHAQAEVELHRWREAIADLDRALAIKPDRADALIYRSSARRSLGNLDAALGDVEAALKLAPDSVPGLLERGNLRRLKGDNAGAAADWRQIEKLAPNSDAAKAAGDNLAELARNPSGEAEPPR